MTDIALTYATTSDGTRPDGLTSPGRVLCVAALLPGFMMGTWATPPELSQSHPYYIDDGSWTGSGLSAPQSHSEMLGVIHERTEASWSEIANLFGVSRRSIHYWSAGGTLSRVHQQSLEEFSELLAASGERGRDGFALLRDEASRRRTFAETTSAVEVRQGPKFPDEKVDYGPIEASISLS